MDLSIIIPCHDLEPFIAPMIESLKKQVTDYEYEIIFILDSCTDGTYDIVRMSNIADIIYQCEVHSCGLARNKGIEFARGDYIWFMDGDDFLLSDYAIQMAMDYIITNGYDMIQFPFESDKYKGTHYSMVWQYLFKRETIGDLRFRSLQPAEDNMFMDEIFFKRGGREVPMLNTPLYFYVYLREGSNMYRHLRGEKI